MNTTRYERRRYAVVRASVWTSSSRIAAASARSSSVVCNGSPCRGRGSRIEAIACLLRSIVVPTLPEHPEQLVDAECLDRDGWDEVVAAEHDIRVLDRLSPGRDRPPAGDGVAELPRDAERLLVARERPGARGAGSEVIER